MMDNRFFNECIAGDETAKLAAIREAIPKWEDLAVQAVKVEEKADPGEMSEDQLHWRGEYINDQYYMIDQTTNSLFAGLAVSVAAVVENMMGMLCEEYHVVLPDRGNWGHKRTGLEGIGQSLRLDGLPGFANVNRARLLGNCFKHNGGKTTDEWVVAVGGAEDEEIRYADENWDAIIKDVRDFLFALVNALPPI